MRNSFIPTAAATLLAVLAPVAGADTLMPVADIYFDAGFQQGNGAKSTLVIQSIGRAQYQALLRFDPRSTPGLSQGIVQKATLNFWVETLTNNTGETPNLEVSEVAPATPAAGNGAWSETDPNFTESFYVQNYTVVSPIGTVPITGKGRWYAIDVTKPVNNWINSRSTTYNSIQIVNLDPASTAVIQLDSKENVGTSHPAFIDVSMSTGGGSGSISGYEMVSVTSNPITNIPPGGNGVFEAVCPEPKVALGGGCTLSSIWLTLYQSSPRDTLGTGWRCGWSNVTNETNGDGGTVTAYAICASAPRP